MGHQYSRRGFAVKSRFVRLAAVPLLAAFCGFGSLAADRDPVAIQRSGDSITFLADDVLVGQYHIGPMVAKPYLWPVHGPGGTALTRGWPMEKASPGGSTDHPHQKSVWFCHGDVIPEGIALSGKVKDVEGIDFWSETPGHGIIASVEVDSPVRSPAGGRIRTRNEWRTPDGRKILDETRTIHLHSLGESRLFVFDIDLHASVAPITFGDTKEGSFGIRINDQIREIRGKGKLENADGKVGEGQCWGRVSAWCDYSGPIDGKTVGLAILDDPRNPYPACWHSRGYGLMAANPFGRAKSGFPAMCGRKDLVHLEKGQHLTLRYGLLIHPGDAKLGKVAESFNQFVKLKD
jgi:Methane oxygenase PmoA